jgi:hypothetical protein
VTFFGGEKRFDNAKGVVREAADEILVFMELKLLGCLQCRRSSGRRLPCSRRNRRYLVGV